MLFIFQLIGALSLCLSTSAGYLRAQESAMTPGTSLRHTNGRQLNFFGNKDTREAKRAEKKN